MRWPFSRRPTGPDGAALYAAIVAETRRADWYRQGEVPDTIDGRFAVLATLMALADIRLGRGGEAARALAARVTEQFITDMDVQMREAGFGDPGLGKQVRMMVGSLASRVERWQKAIDEAGDWDSAMSSSLYRDDPPAADAVAFASTLVRGWWQRLGAAGDDDLAEGRIA